MRVVLSTLPRQGSYLSWITPLQLEPAEVKYLPLGLLSLATNIQDLRHEVIILDPFSERWSIKETAEKINNLNPDIVGFTVATRWSYSLFKLLPLVEAEWKIVGGPHCTYHAQELRTWGADTVFVGSLADEEFRNWVNAQTEGIINCHTNINSIDFPKRNLMNYERYFFQGKVVFEAKRRMSMFSSVGCPNACVFCSVQTKKVCRKHPSLVLGEMNYLRDTCGAKSIHVFDDNFNVDKAALVSLIKFMELDNFNMEWSFRGQVKCDLSLIPRMKALGLKRIHVGIESFNDNVLRWMRKNHRLHDIIDFCKTMEKNDIEVLGYFIVGTPYDNLEYFKETCAVLKIKPYVNVLFPEPDTPYCSQAGLDNFWKKYFEAPYPDAEVPGKNLEVMKLAEELIS